MTATKPAPAAPKKDAPKKETLQQLKNRLRNEAEREVIHNHREEFYKIAEAKFQSHGLPFVRRLSEEEKAAEKVRELMGQFPGLADMLSAQQQQDVASATEPGASDEAAREEQ